VRALKREYCQRHGCGVMMWQLFGVLFAIVTLGLMVVGAHGK